MLLLDVADDGVGFDPDADTAGYGLVGMRHRLAGVGGTLTVESAVGYGTTLNAAVPLPGVDR
jgi:signal transduction histidine kinase